MFSSCGGRSERPEARAYSAHQTSPGHGAQMVIRIVFFSKKKNRRRSAAQPLIDTLQCTWHQSSRVQTVRQKGARVKAPRAAPASTQIVLLPGPCPVPVPQPLKTNPNSLSVSTSICSVPRSPPAAAARCLPQQTHRRPLSRPDRRASPRRLHPLFVLPSVRRGVWCGFVAPDVVALRASNCITAPSSVRQVLLPSCTVISSRAVFFLVSTLNIDRVLGRHPFSPPPLPHLPRALPRWQRLSLPAPRCRSGRSPSERLADHQPHRGPNPSPDPNPPPRPSPRVPTAGAASARHHPLVTRTRPRPRHPHPP